MLLRLLQTIQFKSFATAAIIYVLLQMGNWFYPQVAPNDISNIASIIALINKQFALSFAIKAAILITAGLALQSTALRHEVIYKNTALVFFFYLIFNSLIPSLAYLSVYSFLSLILVLVFRQTLLLHNNTDPNHTLFSSGVLIGIGAILEPVFSGSLLFIVFGFSRFVPFSLKSIFILLLGLIFPWMCVGTITYFNPSIFQPIAINPVFSFVFSLDAYQIGILLIVITLAIFGAFWWAGNLTRNTVKSRRIIQTILVAFVNLAAITAFSVGKNIHAIELLSLPISLCLAYFFSSSKKIKLRNSLLLILIIAVLFVQYHNLFYL